MNTNISLPKAPKLIEHISKNRAVFEIEELYPGYGLTLGNALRRVLLSSLQGAAVTSVKFDGVLHEFSTVPGVKEDVTDILLNLKELKLKLNQGEEESIRIDIKGPKEVKASDLELPASVELLNPDLHIATLTKNIKFHVEMEVGRGRGYYPAEKNKKEGQSIGVIPVDSIFTPIVKVNFQVENTRVGQITDYDKLILEIWTNGSVSPKDALLYSAHILQKHLDIFLNYGKLPKEEIEEEVKVDDEFYSKLRMPVSELELSVRSANCLKEAKIKTIGELVQKNEAEMLKYRNFGKKSLAEIKEIITGMGLGLGMKVDKKLLKKE